jgi:hypothetical protein
VLTSNVWDEAEVAACIWDWLIFPIIPNMKMGGVLASPGHRAPLLRECQPFSEDSVLLKSYTPLQHFGLPRQFPSWLPGDAAPWRQGNIHAAH